MSRIAIIDYGSGNLRSVAKAFERAIAEAGLVSQVVVTADPDVVRAAERIVLPGVGAFGDCKAGLDGLTGMVEAMEERVLKAGRPFLGICVGMQLLATVGREHGAHDGLNWIPGEVVEMKPADPALKIPHMGWNELKVRRVHPLLDGLDDGAHAYFVHSYRFVPADPQHVLAIVEYGGVINAVVCRDNVAGTQFHPEKSQATGLKVITNFLTWRP